MENYSQALGYGFWCNKACAERKMAAGIPPLGSGRADKQKQAATDAALAEAASKKALLEEQRKLKTSWTPLALAGVITVSLVGIAIMVFVIKKAQK